MENEKEIKYFSMFTGVGGFELGLEQTNQNWKSKGGFSEQLECIQQSGNKPNDSSRKRRGLYEHKAFSCVGFSEIDKYANELLKNKFPSIKNWGDATKINPSELPDFDMLCGGFPCQAFSIAGKRRGFQDTRGTLFFDIARILKVKRPKIVFLENVKGLLNHEKGKTFRTIIQTLSELGYDIQWMVLNSKFFGVPQNRERVFIIGSLRGECRPEILPFGKTDTETNQEGIIHPTLTEAIGRQGCSKEYIRSCQTILDINQAQRVYSTEGTSITISDGGGQGAKTGLYAMRGRNPENPSDRTAGSPTEQRLELNKDGTTNTISTVQKDNLWINNMRIRRLTPTECERLQGFSDGWTEGFSDTQRYKMMGNAVTVNVIKAIASKLK